MNKICLDASVWIKVLTEEPDSHVAHQLVSECIEKRSQIIAPELMMMEVGSILRKKFFKKLMKQDVLRECWTLFMEMPIDYIQDKSLFIKAWEIAEQHNLSHLYDAVYLAVSEDIPFWTADKRLVNNLRGNTKDIYLLGEY